MALDYNVSAKLKKLKKLAQSHFLLGNSVKVVVGLTGVSEHIIQTWHDEFVLSTLKESSSRRIFTRELLLKNAPGMIMILAQLAKQKGDEKLAYSAASAVLSFGTRFLSEDARIQSLENKLAKENDNDPGLKRTLFDLVSPDDVMKDKRKKAHAEAEPLSEDDEDLVRAYERLEKQGVLPGDNTPQKEHAESDDISSYYEQDHKQSQHPSVDLFDGIDDDDNWSVD